MEKKQRKGTFSRVAWQSGHTNCTLPFLWLFHSSAHFGFIAKINFCILMMPYLLFRRDYFLFHVKGSVEKLRCGGSRTRCAVPT